jgi:hypothetical protein
MGAAFMVYSHARVEVRKMVCRSRSPYGSAAGRVEAEEKHARLAAIVHVCTNIQFRETRCPGNRRQPASADSGHVERRDRHPALSMEVSSAKTDGTSSRKFSGATGQCANSRSFQVCSMIQGREGSGQGRWSTNWRAACMGQAYRVSDDRVIDDLRSDPT